MISTCDQIHLHFHVKFRMRDTVERLSTTFTKRTLSVCKSQQPRCSNEAFFATNEWIRHYLAARYTVPFMAHKCYVELDSHRSVSCHSPRLSCLCYVFVCIFQRLYVDVNALVTITNRFNRMAWITMNNSSARRANTRNTQMEMNE